MINNSKSLLPFKLGEPAVQASLIIGSITIITVVLGFIFKDYLIPRWIEKRQNTLRGEQLFKKYKTNLFNSTLSFSIRLKEIYRTRSHYLLSSAPENSFYDYKYKSSVYRLCALLGWIRAFRIDESSISIKGKDKGLHKINQVLRDFERSLADGQGVEMYIAKAICEINQIDWRTLNLDVINKFSVEIDHLMQRYINDCSVLHFSEVSENKHDGFVQDLDVLMKKLEIKFDSQKLKYKNKEIIKEVSVKVSLIYRDWQQSIGDLMLVKLESTSGRELNVIGYKDFEQMWSADLKSIEKIWLNRAQKLFENLDLTVDPNFDSRIPQLKSLYSCLYNLLWTLYNINDGGQPIAQNEFDKIAKIIG